MHAYITRNRILDLKAGITIVTETSGFNFRFIPI